MKFVRNELEYAYNIIAAIYFRMENLHACIKLDNIKQCNILCALNIVKALLCNW